MKEFLTFLLSHPIWLRLMSGPSLQLSFYFSQWLVGHHDTSRVSHVVSLAFPKDTDFKEYRIQNYEIHTKIYYAQTYLDYQLSSAMLIGLTVGARLE